MMGVAAKFAAKAGRIDAVINNAMLLRYEPLEKISEAVLTRMVAIGINGSVWGAQALLAHYDATRGGSLINMASPVAGRGFPNTAAYSLVKGALVTFPKVLAAELGPKNIRVNALSPGSVPTPGALGLNDKAEYERRARSIPLRRLGHEDDNADACVFLLSPQASFINGEILHVDGGIAAAG
jgi:NAD(P)-dependent dehydrogenase (short-subunit alcohol dehydrogenase family)